MANLNGHKLYVEGKEYASGTASEGTSFDIDTGNGSGSGTPSGTPPDGGPPKKP